MLLCETGKRGDGGVEGLGTSRTSRMDVSIASLLAGLSVCLSVCLCLSLSCFSVVVVVVVVLLLLLFFLIWVEIQLLYLTSPSIPLS